MLRLSPDPSKSAVERAATPATARPGADNSDPFRAAGVSLVNPPSPMGQVPHLAFRRLNAGACVWRAAALLPAGLERRPGQVEVKARAHDPGRIVRRTERA